MEGGLDMSRYTTAGQRPVDSIGFNEFLLGRRMCECFGDNASFR